MTRRAAGRSLRRRVSILITLAAIVVAVIAVGALAAFRDLSRARERLADRLDPALVQSGTLLASLVDQETGVRGFVLSGQSEFLEPWTAGRQQEQTVSAELRSLLAVRRGDIFSRKAVTTTTELMQLRLGQDGYAFAKIDPVPKEDPKTKEIELTFLVDPGNRAYVRNITFSGSTGINDDVLRREMRQMEGGYLSNAAVERSKSGADAAKITERRT